MSCVRTITTHNHQPHHQCFFFNLGRLEAVEVAGEVFAYYGSLSRHLLSLLLPHYHSPFNTNISPPSPTSPITSLPPLSLQYLYLPTISFLSYYLTTTPLPLILISPCHLLSLPLPHYLFPLLSIIFI